MTDEVTTLAGNGREGYSDRVATAAQFYALRHLAIDRDDNLYAADNNRVRKISRSGEIGWIGWIGERDR